jgi:hypothetical protein
MPRSQLVAGGFGKSGTNWRPPLMVVTWGSDKIPGIDVHPS